MEEIGMGSLEGIIDNLEDAFWILEKLKGINPGHKSEFKRILKAVKELEDCHETLYTEFLEREKRDD